MAACGFMEPVNPALLPCLWVWGGGRACGAVFRLVLCAGMAVLAFPVSGDLFPWLCLCVLEVDGVQCVAVFWPCFCAGIAVFAFPAPGAAFPGWVLGCAGAREVAAFVAAFGTAFCAGMAVFAFPASGAAFPRFCLWGLGGGASLGVVLFGFDLCTLSFYR